MRALLTQGCASVPSRNLDQAPKKITGIPKKTLLNYGDTVKAGAKPYK